MEHATAGGAYCTIFTYTVFVVLYFVTSFLKVPLRVLSDFEKIEVTVW